jgi:hypothetical protein
MRLVLCISFKLVTPVATMCASSEMQKNVKLVTPAHNNFLRKWGHTYDLSILVANTQLLTFLVCYVLWPPLEFLPSLITDCSHASFNFPNR